MATTIKTVMTYDLDGSTTDFNVPFEYLARKFVQVTLIGQDRKVLVLNTDYRFVTKTTISTMRAWGAADGYQQIEIRRYTSATERLVDFTDGSILRAYDLNVSQIQTLHVAEEARDMTADTIGINNDGHLDARGRKIVNLADATEAGDAVSFGQMQRFDGSAYNSMVKAKESEANAKTSETNAKDSETNAKSQADRAKTEADRTDGKAAEAAASATAAKTSETNSKTSETNSKSSEERAILEANKLIEFNVLTDRINSVAVRQVGEFEVHNSRSYAKPGTVYGDGQILNRNQYPTLVAELLAGHLPIVSDAVWLADPGKRGCYTLGNGTSTFRVPDLNGVYAGSIKAPVFRGDAGFTIGDVQESGVPNVKGTAGFYARAADTTQPEGPFSWVAKTSLNVQGSANDARSGLNIDLSKVSSVYKDGLTEARANSLVIVWVVRTHGVVNNPGSVDAAVLASRVEQVYTELQTRIVLNENRLKAYKLVPRVIRNTPWGTSEGAVDFGEVITGKTFRLHFTTAANLFAVHSFIVPPIGSTYYLQIGAWQQQYKTINERSLQLTSASGGSGQPQLTEVMEIELT